MSANLQKLSQAVQNISTYSGPDDNFLEFLLHIQLQMTGVSSAIIMTNDELPLILAEYGEDTDWHEIALQGSSNFNNRNKSFIQAISRASAEHQILYIPINDEEEQTFAYAAYLCKDTRSEFTSDIESKLRITLSLIAISQSRKRLREKYQKVVNLKKALEILTVCNHYSKFKTQAIAICNELAVRWQCNRVSLGYLKGRYVKAIAISNCEKITRKMSMIQEIETVMEESLDQDCEILYPDSQDSTYVARSSERYCQKNAVSSVLAVPLREHDQPKAVILLEAKENSTFNEKDIALLRLTAELLSPRFFELAYKDKWIGSKALMKCKSFAALLLGAKYTWIKLTAITITAAILFLCYAKGTYYVESDFIISPYDKKMVVAPFDANLEKVNFKTNDYVDDASTTLAKLETSELELQLYALKAKLEETKTKISVAKSEKKWSEEKILETSLKQVQIEMDLIIYKIKQSVIKANHQGYIISKDLNQMIGAPISKGDLLFVIIPNANHEAELYVKEDQIDHLAEEYNKDPTLAGKLAVHGYPSRKIDFEIISISPVAEIRNNENCFKVTCRITTKDEQWLRPGMEGIARIAVSEKKHYAWIWSRRLINYLRIKLWF